MILNDKSKELKGRCAFVSNGHVSINEDPKLNE